MTVQRSNTLGDCFAGRERSLARQQQAGEDGAVLRLYFEELVSHRLLTAVFMLTSPENWRAPVSVQSLF